MQNVWRTVEYSVICHLCGPVWICPVGGLGIRRTGILEALTTVIEMLVQADSVNRCLVAPSTIASDDRLSEVLMIVSATASDSTNMVSGVMFRLFNAATTGAAIFSPFSRT